MKPIGRPAFLLATLGCLVIVVLMVTLVRVSEEQLLAYERGVDVEHMVKLTLAVLLVAGMFVLGLWGWFVARRFLARGLARWPAVLPVAFWTIALASLLLVLEVYDRTLSDVAADVGPVLPGDDTGDAAREQAFQAAVRDEIVRQYAGAFSFAVTSLAVVATMWCAIRALGRDPVPVEDHFA